MMAKSAEQWPDVGSGSHDGATQALSDKGPRVRRRALLWTAAVFALCLGLLQTSPGHRLLSAAGLAPAPSRYLELYFTHPGDQPTGVPAPGGLVQVSFVIRSHDLTVNNQGWAIAVSNATTARTTATGSVSLAPGGQASITRTIVVPCAATAGSRTSVSVSLSGTTQQILFWVSCGAPATRPATTATPGTQ